MRMTNRYIYTRMIERGFINNGKEITTKENS